jgi:hypothetical protein
MSGLGPQVRLAELVAALSLGVDLGFGQPMEHVLRQCLVALRLAEVLELYPETRAVVYYTALLVGVGCHSDAHEQAKWFGDDIALKAGKYDGSWGTLRGAARMLARIGSGNRPIHRFRVGLEFAVSGRRDVDDMIVNHIKLARSFAEQIGLPGAVVESLGAAYEHWDGRGWPRGLSGAEVPLPARIAGLAEFIEVAHRGARAARDAGRARVRCGAARDRELHRLEVASHSRARSGSRGAGRRCGQRTRDVAG